MTTAKRMEKRGELEEPWKFSITNESTITFMQISTQALLNCICPVFTNNLSRSHQSLVTNIHIHVCVCVYSNAQKRVPGA